MSGLSVPLPPGRQRALAVEAALADLDAELAQLREALPLANDPALRPALDQLGTFARTAGSVLESRGKAIDQRLVDAVADLLGTLRLVRLPSRDPEFGFTLGLRELRGAQGQIVLTLTNTLAAAAALGLRPSQPEAADALAAELPRSLFDDKLAGIAAQLDAVADRLEALDAAWQATEATSPEAGLVEFYLATMRVEVDLARLSLTLGDRTIDFAALARATGAMADLTGDFLATLQGWAVRVSAAIRQAAERIRVPIRLMVTGLRAAAREAADRVALNADATILHAPPLESAQADPAEPEGFSAEAVLDLILSGKPVPAAWVPLVKDLDFSGTNLSDLSPLAGLTELRRLVLGCTYSEGKENAAAPVVDLTPLAGLVALESLGLRRTQVSDLTPLAGLPALQHLDLKGTPVIDLTPLAGLPALQHLGLKRTPVSDLTPLAGLAALQSLDLAWTQVGDLTPIAGLAALLLLNLSGTRVSNLTPIAGLSALLLLDASGTRVSDLTPLAGLTELQSLSLMGMPVSDLTPLAGLAALQSLFLNGTWASDLTPLAGLTELRSLHLLETPVSDLRPIAGLPALHVLDLTMTRVSDVTPLAGLTELRTLRLAETAVRDVSALRDLRIEIDGGPSAKATNRIGSAVQRLFRRGHDQT